MLVGTELFKRPVGVPNKLYMVKRHEAPVIIVLGPGARAGAAGALATFHAFQYILGTAQRRMKIGRLLLGVTDNGQTRMLVRWTSGVFQCYLGVRMLFCATVRLDSPAGRVINPGV